MQDWIERHVNGVSVRGFVVIFRWKNKSQLEESYWFVVAGRSWGFELEQVTAIAFSNALSRLTAVFKLFCLEKLKLL